MVERPSSPISRSKRNRQRRRRGKGVIVAVAALSGLLAWQLIGTRCATPATAPTRSRAEGPERDNPTTAYEPTDWRPGPVGLLFVGILALLVISCFVLIAAYPTSLPDVDRNVRISPPGPRLQTNPQSDLARFQAEEAKRLNNYYWIDKQKGVVHIPIEQAMKKLATTGIPGLPKGEP